jgi:hypothetical protein
MKLPKFLECELEPTLEEAQEFVDGYVELLELENGDCLLMNDEAKLYQNSQVNAKATTLAGRLILGNVIHVKKKNRKGW